MQIEFDNLAVYAASIDIWKPILIEWDAHTIPWQSSEDEPDNVSGFGYHTVESDEEHPDKTGRYDRHVIGLDPRAESVEEILRSARHELEHARQLEAVGYYEWYASYLWYVEILTRNGGPDSAAQYHWNPYEVEARDAADAEWRDLLPCVKGTI